MMTRRAFAASGIASVLAGQAPALLAQSPAASRRAEVAALRRFAETTHPRGREAAADSAWQASWASLEERAERMSDGAYLVGMRSALGWFDDGHTSVFPFEFTGGIPEPLRAGPLSLSLPLTVRLYDDGAYVVAAAGEALPLLGGRVTHVGAFDVVTLVRRFAQGWPGNDAWGHRWAGSVFAQSAQLEGLGAVADPRRPVAFRTAAGAVELVATAQGAALRPMERRATQREGWAAEARRGNYVRPLPDRDALYLSIDEMGDVEGRSFLDLTRDAFAAIDAGGASRLVIDLRRNGGGNNFLGEALRKRIAASRFNRPGALYVLIGPATFSAAQNLANRLERETFALFVGGPTGGAPNHYGDARPLLGAATGIYGFVSTIPWFDSYPQDRRDWILPDLPIADSFADWQAGRDPVLEAALTHRVENPLHELTEDRVFFYRRASQRAAWSPFWRPSA